MVARPGRVDRSISGGDSGRTRGGRRRADRCPVLHRRAAALGKPRSV